MCAFTTIVQQALEEVDVDIKINADNVRDADDTIAFADSMERLQEIMNGVTEVNLEYGLLLNAKRAKYLIISKNNIRPDQL